ncbi:MAG TPA: alginate lyase family protein, partial [Bryobacteraceae bacterium]|nr:alginate lyase family protein [Bryobacteraceae bacterium]
MRSAEEIRFRLTQEAMNVFLWVARPAPPAGPFLPSSTLPDPSAVAKKLKGSQWASDTEAIARGICGGNLPLLGIKIDTSGGLHWRRDYVSGIETPPDYFRRVPYLNAAVAGDHKVVWELNRHQHLTLLAQAFVLTADPEFLNEIERQLTTWFDQNPFQCGINWASALEVGFRALSWIWVLHLAGSALSGPVQQRLRTELYRHGLHLEYNLSRYFSRNTHLLGEAVALHAIGRLFPQFPKAGRWERLGAEIVRGELQYQVLPDGAHFEKSSYYHVYALDFFLLHYLLSGRPTDYQPVLGRMAEYLDALLGPGRQIPFIGDDDGGRLFYPYGIHNRFGRATIATAAVLLDRSDWEWELEDLYPQAIWWIGPAAVQDESAPKAKWQPRSTRFEHSGLVVSAAGDTQVLVDAGSFGAGRGGHSHSDTLEILVRNATGELLVDPGTFTYVGDPAWRDWFRGSAAHNTVRINDLDQAEAAGPFVWRTKPEVVVHAWQTGTEFDFLDAAWSYAGFTHRRRFLFLKPGLILIADRVDGAAQDKQRIQQFWHTGPVCRDIGPSCYSLDHGVLAIAEGHAVAHEVGGVNGWRSRALGHKEASPVVVVTLEQELPVVAGAAIEIGRDLEPARLAVALEGDEITMRFHRGDIGTTAVFPAIGPVRVFRSTRGGVGY